MEGVKSLDCGPEELPGVEGAERSDGGGGNWGGPPRPGSLRLVAVGASRPITGDEPGSGRGPGGSRRRPYYCLSRPDSKTGGEGRAAASFTRHAQGRAGECHIVARTTKQDKVRELQRTLYRAAKADPGRRFHALYDKVLRRDVLERAWELVRANRGAAGIDKQTIADVEHHGIAKLLDELAADLGNGSYRPLPARRVFIPKPGRPNEQRPLSIPAVRDRVVQSAVKIVIEPIFEADFLPCSFGFRPKRSAHDALQVLIDESWRGRRWIAGVGDRQLF